MSKDIDDMFPHTTERAKTAVDQVGRTVWQMTYFLSSRATWRRLFFCPNKSRMISSGWGWTWMSWILTSAESKATYQEIKAYVWKQFGLKVSTLYISQVKRKCGLDVGQNYNRSKREDAKVLRCPLEKEEAIRTALRHFQMI